VAKKTLKAILAEQAAAMEEEDLPPPTQDY